MQHTYWKLADTHISREATLLQPGDVADCGVVFEGHEIVEWGAPPEPLCPDCGTTY